MPSRTFLKPTRWLEQPLVETVAVLVVGGDIPQHVAEQVEPGRTRVGAGGPELLLLVEVRRRLAERRDLEDEDGLVVALVVEEADVGGALSQRGRGPRTLLRPRNAIEIDWRTTVGIAVRACPSAWGGRRRP